MNGRKVEHLPWLRSRSYNLMNLERSLLMMKWLHSNDYCCVAQLAEVREHQESFEPHIDALVEHVHGLPFVLEVFGRHTMIVTEATKIAVLKALQRKLHRVGGMNCCLDFHVQYDCEL